MSAAANDAVVPAGPIDSGVTRPQKDGSRERAVVEHGAMAHGAGAAIPQAQSTHAKQDALAAQATSVFDYGDDQDYPVSPSPPDKPTSTEAERQHAVLSLLRDVIEEMCEEQLGRQPVQQLGQQPAQQEHPGQRIVQQPDQKPDQQPCQQPVQHPVQQQPALQPAPQPAQISAQGGAGGGTHATAARQLPELERWPAIQLTDPERRCLWLIGGAVLFVVLLWVYGWIESTSFFVGATERAGEAETMWQGIGHTLVDWLGKAVSKSPQVLLLVMMGGILYLYVRLVPVSVSVVS